MLLQMSYRGRCAICNKSARQNHGFGSAYNIDTIPATVERKYYLEKTNFKVCQSCYKDHRPATPVGTQVSCVGKPIKVRSAGCTPANAIRGSTLSPTDRRNLEMRTTYPVIASPTGNSLFSNEFICNLIGSMPCASLLNVHANLDEKYSIAVDRPSQNDLSNVCTGRLELISYELNYAESSFVFLCRHCHTKYTVNNVPKLRLNNDDPRKPGRKRHQSSLIHILAVVLENVRYQRY